MSERKAKRIFFKRENLMRYISLVSIVVLAIVFNLIQPNFLGKMNISSIFRDVAVLLIMAVGMT
ncbi:MAG: ribose ABC transporter permease, partial [Clostridia bacterium]|nr:ribose ABC transporter permease [Clostridia bacterium]